jgi:SAM-dependent MidA family methyltransferase
MDDFERLIIDEVRRRGQITFAEFMEWALYHPGHGYYTAGPVRTGRQGDFFTNVQVGPLFGRLLAESIVEMWDHLGSGRIHLVELGAGDGTLAEQILRALEERGRAKAVTLTLVEKSARGREAARRRLSRFPKVRLLEDLRHFEHAAGVEGCVYSNEFFDALPFHRVQRREGRLWELYVRESEGRLAEAAGAPSTPRLAQYLEERGVALAEGQKAEIRLLLDVAVAELDRALSRGFVLTVDYGEPSLDLYRETRPEGTLQAYESHRLEADALLAPGRRDLTAHVDFGRLAAEGMRRDWKPLVFASQGAFFLSSGERVLRQAVENDAGIRKNTSMVAPTRGISPRHSSLARSASQVQQLVHPEAFGGLFHVLVQGKNVGQPVLSGGKVNRVHRLLPSVSRP